MADLGIKLNNLVNAVNALDKIYIETDIETPDNVLEQLSNIKSYTMELLSDLYEMTDVQPVKHGRWTYPYKDKDINQCSECHSYVQDKISNVREMFAYCPFCGARMEQEG